MKKYLSILLCSTLFATVFQTGTAVGNVDAASSSITSSAEVTAKPIINTDVKSGKNDASPENLENAIKTVKSKYEIPKEYSEFEYYFNDSRYSSGTNWYLTWRNPKDYSYIQFGCDSDFHITYFNSYDNSRDRGGVPAYLKNELKGKADKFIALITPKVANKLKLIDSSYNGIYSGSYSYLYQRIENGVAFPDNTVEVTVDATTGEIRSASINWLYNLTIPKADTKLTKEEAAKLIGENLKMELVYKTDYYGIYDKTSGEYKQKAYLVYQPTGGYISVDAKTGEVYLTHSEWIQRDDKNDEALADEDKANGMDSSSSNILTEEEIAKINELEKIISKEKAIDIITKNKYLYLEDSLISYSANLNKYSAGKDTKYVWNISFQDPRPIDYDKEYDYYRAYASAQVDAKTGKILNYYSSTKDYYDYSNNTWKQVKVKFTQEQCRKLLEEFLKKEIKNRFNNSRHVSTNDDYVIAYKDNNPVYGGYYYRYNRVNEGLDYPYNGIYASVEGITGKIYNYSSYWDENIEFESPKGAMTPEEAFDKYISKDGFNLLYEVNEINIYSPYEGNEKYYDYYDSYELVNEVRLVYRPDISPSYISPFTGDQLNYDGTVYNETKPYAYVDIPDNKDYRNILLFADMNIGFEGKYFYPEKNITVAELNELIDKIGYGYYPLEESTKPSEATEKLITREQLAAKLINILGLDAIANLKGIYYTGYTDNNSIAPEKLGAVALAKGFGLITADEFNMFNPKNNITRREVVDILVNFISLQRSGIYN